jgi:cytoskeletal protein CcmA (bactofilin family)
MAEEQKPAAPPPETPPKPGAIPSEDDSLDAPAGAADQSPAQAAGTGVGEPKEVAADSKGGLRNSFNIYYILFVLIILLAIGGVFYAVKTSTKSNNPQKTASLTSAQLATLKGNTTVVGDTKQTLDVQSNAVFEGQVLVRSDLSVAGALKVGGPLSLQTINVSGSGNFGGIQVNGTLGVTGNTSLQGELSVQKNLTVGGSASFGSLAVASLSVSSLQLTGDLNVVRHIVTSGTSVSRVAGTALGSGGTVSASGTDTAGTVVVNTGNSPPAGLFITITFAQKFATTPHVIISPVGFAAGSVTYYVTRDTGGFSIGCSTPPPAGSSFSFDYIVLD